MNEVFRFNLNDWRAAIFPPAPVPDEIDVKVFLDPAMTAGSQSDDSAFATGYLHEDILTVLEISAAKWKGQSLIDEAMRLILRWRAFRFDYEIVPGTDFFELLLKAQIKEWTDWPIIIRGIHPNTRQGSKKNRISRLDNLLKVGKLHLHSGPWIDPLFREVELFDPSCASNHRRKDNMLDSLAYLAGYR